MVLFKDVTIIGVGLIGGSLARALKAKNLAARITGSGRSRQSLEQALRMGVIDRMGQGPAYGVEEADLVVLASPIGTFEKITREMGPHLKKGAILTDVGSVKGKLIKSIEDTLPAGVHYVPAHPIAGREKSGVAEAAENLFADRRCILTPGPTTDKKAVELVQEMWRSVGSKVTVMDAHLHDKVFAAVSHLPHVAAFAMMCAVGELNTGNEDYIDFSGAGFRDFTRIAASSPEMWKDICIINKENIVPMIDRYVFCLNRLKREIAAGDEGRLEKRLKVSSDLRRELK